MKMKWKNVNQWVENSRISTNLLQKYLKNKNKICYENVKIGEIFTCFLFLFSQWNSCFFRKKPIDFHIDFAVNPWQKVLISLWSNSKAIGN